LDFSDIQSLVVEASADSATTDEDTPLNNIDVLSNDAGPNLSVSSFDATSTQEGTVSKNADGTLNYTPKANFNGTDTFTYEACDDVVPEECDEATVSITVNAVNDAPVNTVPGAQSTDEDTALVFSSGNGNRISTSDVDAGSNAVKVTVGVSHGKLTLSQTTGLSFTSGANGDATISFTGTLSDINAALDGLSY
jgi:VCBS repeat-containing protein